MAPFAPVSLGRIDSTYSLEGLRLTATVHAGGTVLRPHDHEDYTASVVLEGGVEERVGRKTYDCRPGTLLTKPPGQHHANRYFGTTVPCIVIQLTSGFAGHQWSAWLPMDRVVFRKRAVIGRIARRLSRILANPDQPASDSIALTETWGLLSLCAPTPTHNIPTQWIAETRSLLVEEDLPNSIGAVAARVGVAPWVLSRAFQETYGVSPSQYRRRARLERVARRLLDSETPISTLAHSAGFADHSHLVRWFRRAYGCTPTEYRHNHRKSVLALPSRQH